ncbi:MULTISPECIES: SDR family NAD(P)-dependent oxidoreductase [Rufibacter]|uniref:NAD(P)-dependent dehydrogenase (Short-subunit alcohol dehydrogenase family) n=1 Tax=Rufibacter quisquiliarum TaxID=1549639 RepID=A0A839GJ08_9BACT|nr:MULTISPECIES: glucose 1-dehydrogenase [Rufibacter]MBA9076739.1 NAD(P)-dependent dehydrogenase (short-subunit alcohol dehydrogenase family) [Rufibacter quisquiliarum]
MQSYYSSKVVLITGGAQGIGLGMAQAFAQAGAQVVITDLDQEAGQEALERLKGQNLTLTFIACDVSQEQQVQQLMAQVQEKFGRLDVLVNNAGIASPPRTPLAELPISEFDQVLGVNLRGPLLCSKYALPLLKKAAHPAILNITSTRAFMSEPNTFAYSASKGGLEALTHSLAISLGPKIRVNAISPGWIETGPWEKESKRYEPHHRPQDKAQHPVGRVGTPEDIARAALFLCSDQAGFITGQRLTIDGGMTVKMIYHDE